MGTYRIEIENVGGHGCKREPKEGERVYGCRRLDCPDCLTADFVERLCRGSGGYLKATLTHWPGDPSQVVDRISVNERGYVEVTRETGDFFTRIDVGDSVQLKSGGPAMRVMEVGTRIRCGWEDGETANIDSFDRAMLRKLPPQPSPSDGAKT